MSALRHKRSLWATDETDETFPRSFKTIAKGAVMVQFDLGL